MELSSNPYMTIVERSQRPAKELMELSKQLSQIEFKCYEEPLLLGEGEVITVIASADEAFPWRRP